MDCKDLTICDYVKHNGATKVVDAVYLYSVSVHDPSEEWSISEAKTYSVDDIEPIKLTEDILVKNGFDKDERSRYYHEYILELELWDFDISWTNAGGFKYEDIRLAYVHQLQHLLRLAGVQKEIEHLWHLKKGDNDESVEFNTK